MPPVKLTWIEKAKETHKFHRSKLLKDDSWTATKTAKALNRSAGSIYEDLLIARWLRTHGKQLEKFDFSYEALKFIRAKEREIELEEIE